MRSLISELTRNRVSKWFLQAKPINTAPTWTETRLVIEIGGKIYPITDGQVFQCAHCGTFDHEWNKTEVLAYLKEHFGTDPYEIEVICSMGGE